MEALLVIFLLPIYIYIYIYMYALYSLRTSTGVFEQKIKNIMYITLLQPLITPILIYYLESTVCISLIK